MSYLFMERCSNLEFEAIKNVMYHFLSASGLVDSNTYEAETAADLIIWDVF